MSTCTPVYGLPYATGSDRPCDIGETFCEFVTIVETLLQGFESSLNRTARSIPMAKVSTTVSQALGINIVFDAEEVDTDNMVDLSIADLGVTIQRSGKFVVASYSTQSDAGGVGDMILLNERNGFGMDQQTQRFGGTALGAHGISVTTFAPRTSADLTPANWAAGDFVSLSPNGVVGTTMDTIPEAEMMVYWTGDPS